MATKIANVEAELLVVNEQYLRKETEQLRKKQEQLREEELLLREEELLLREEKLLLMRQAAANTTQATRAGLRLVLNYKGPNQGQESEEEESLRSRLFCPPPSLDAVFEYVAEQFVELEVELFDVMVDDAQIVDEAAWQAAIRGKQTITIKVVNQVKAFSSYTQDHLPDLLNVRYDEILTDSTAFHLADVLEEEELDEVVKECLGLHTVKDLLSFMGKELALRCLHTTPEASRRELIGPLLFATAALAGAVDVVAEYKASGSLARGNIDYALLYKDFCIVVVEGKLDTLLDSHVGQLAAEIRTTREAFLRRAVQKPGASERTKRKRQEESEADKKIPSFGILTNGLKYVFYKYQPSEWLPLVRSYLMELALPCRVSAANAATAAMPIVRTLLHLLKDQKELVDTFEKGKKPKTGASGTEAAPSSIEAPAGPGVGDE